MKRGIGIVLGAMVALGGAGAVAGRIWPEQTAQAMLAAYSASAGLTLRSVQTPVGPVGYFEGGEGPQTVVLLHGIFARKEHWIDLSRQITDGYRVIIPDLPGFGDNPILPAEAYAYARQEANVRALLDAIGVGSFHLAGNSMGGQIAGQLAADLPGRVLSVAFIGSPVGIDTPRRSPFQTMMSQEGYTMVVSDMQEFEARNALLFPQKPFVPGPIEETWAEDEFATVPAHRRIWAAVNGSNLRPLETIAPTIAQPSLVAWCREDEIFDFSGAEVLAKALPRATLVPLSGCGHVPSLDAPEAAGKALRAFLDGL